MLILDFVLLIMIVTCIIFCWILNRRIQDLHNSRVEFARMIKDLNTSIIKAESSVSELSALSKVTSTELLSSTEKAKEVIQELTILSDIGNDLIDKLTKQQRALKDTTIKNKNTDLFSAEDLAIETDEFSQKQHQPQQDVKHTNKLENTITQINTIKNSEEPINLNQLGYFDSLRKIAPSKK